MHTVTKCRVGIHAGTYRVCAGLTAIHLCAFSSLGVSPTEGDPQAGTFQNVMVRCNATWLLVSSVCDECHQDCCAAELFSSAVVLPMRHDVSLTMTMCLSRSVRLLCATAAMRNSLLQPGKAMVICL